MSYSTWQIAKKAEKGMAAGNRIDTKGEGSLTVVKHVVSVPVWIVISVFSKLLVDELGIAGVKSDTHAFYRTLYC